MKVNDQYRQWEGLMRRRRGAALAGWLGGAVGARSKPAFHPYLPHPVAAKRSGLALRPHRPLAPPSRRRAPTTSRHCRFWLLRFVMGSINENTRAERRIQQPEKQAL